MKLPRFQYRLSTLFLAMTATAIGVTAYRLAAPSPETPESWDLDEVARAALHPGETALDRDILVWQIKEDGRPLLVHSCIAWLHVRDQSGRAFFRVSHLYRHPDWYKRWCPSIVFDTIVPFEEEFRTPPSSDQVLQFIDRTEWNWQLDEDESGLPYGGKVKRFAGLNYRDGRVCQRAWKRRTGTSFSLDVPSEFLRPPGGD